MMIVQLVLSEWQKDEKGVEDGNLEIVKGVFLALVVGAAQLVLPADAGSLVPERYLQRDGDAIDSSRGVREDVVRGMLPGFKRRL